uniref:hypothetical protein n=1 Tax=Clostridium sp. NkU-1 TaxID=1095009 RepID=UPI0006D105F8
MYQKKIGLEAGDIFALFTRGAWENFGEEEFLEAAKEAKEPKEILDQAEDVILGQQETGEVDNYSLAVTFIEKVYQPPKKLSLKKILMAAIPIVLGVGGISLGLYLHHRSIKKTRNTIWKNT